MMLMHRLGGVQQQVKIQLRITVARKDPSVIPG